MLLPADDVQDDAEKPDDAQVVKSAGESDEMAETDLSSLLDLQVLRHKSESMWADRVILWVIVITMAFVLLWYGVSPTNRRKVDGLIQNVKESRNDLKQVSSPQRMVNAYDEALAKLGSRSADINTATRSLGVDPTTVKEDGLDPEMKGMMGGEGRTVGERQRVVEVLGKAAGIPASKPAAAEMPVEMPPPEGVPPVEEPIPPVDPVPRAAPSPAD